jgi:hypothetical protein
MSTPDFTLAEATRQFKGLPVGLLATKLTANGYTDLGFPFQTARKVVAYNDFRSTRPSTETRPDNDTWITWSNSTSEQKAKEANKDASGGGAYFAFPGYAQSVGAPRLIVTYDNNFAVVRILVRYSDDKFLAVVNVLAGIVVSFVTPIGAFVWNTPQTGSVDQHVVKGAITIAAGQTGASVYESAKTGKVSTGTAISVVSQALDLVPTSPGNKMNDATYDESFNPSGFQDQYMPSAWTDAQNVSYGFNVQPDYTDTLTSSVDTVSEAGAWDFGPPNDVGYYGQGPTPDVTTATFGTQFLGSSSDNEAIYSNEGKNYPPLAAGRPQSWSNQAQEFLGVINAGAKTLSAIGNVYGAVTSKPNIKTPTSGTPRSSTRQQNEAAIPQARSAFGQLFSTGGSPGASAGGSNMPLILGGVVLLAAALLIK